MKKIYLAALYCLLHTMVVARQSVEQQLSKPVIYCEEVRRNALELIPALYKTQPIDSVVRAISFWEQICGICEESQRIKILVAIKNRHFSELLYDSSIVFYIRRYEEEKRERSVVYNSNAPAWLINLKTFNNFTQQLANSLLSVADSTQLEYFFCMLYADKPAPYALLNTPSLQNTRLAWLVKNHSQRVRHMGSTHKAFTAGLWAPTGHAGALGVHPVIGLEWGIKKAIHRIDILAEIRFLNAPQPYQVVKDNQVRDTKHFTGIFIGLQYGRELYSSRKSMVEVLASAGADAFDALPSNNNDQSSKSISSFNFNGGLQYSYFMGADWYLGLRTKYHVVDYRNKGGTSLSGDAITISLVAGMLGNRNNYRYYY